MMSCRYAVIIGDDHGEYCRQGVSREGDVVQMESGTGVVLDIR